MLSAQSAWRAGVLCDRRPRRVRRGLRGARSRQSLCPARSAHGRICSERHGTVHLLKAMPSVGRRRAEARGVGRAPVGGGARRRMEPAGALPPRMTPSTRADPRCSTGASTGCAGSSRRWAARSFHRSPSRTGGGTGRIPHPPRAVSVYERRRAPAAPFQGWRYLRPQIAPATHSFEGERPRDDMPRMRASCELCVNSKALRRLRSLKPPSGPTPLPPWLGASHERPARLIARSAIVFSPQETRKKSRSKGRTTSGPAGPTAPRVPVLRKAGSRSEPSSDAGRGAASPNPLLAGGREGVAAARITAPPCRTRTPYRTGAHSALAYRRSPRPVDAGKHRRGGGNV